MEITPVFSIPSIKRKENNLIVMLLELNKDYCQESNKMSTNKW